MLWCSKSGIVARNLELGFFARNQERSALSAAQVVGYSGRLDTRRCRRVGSLQPETIRAKDRLAAPVDTALSAWRESQAEPLRLASGKLERCKGRLRIGR